MWVEEKIGDLGCYIDCKFIRCLLSFDCKLDDGVMNVDNFMGLREVFKVFFGCVVDGSC